MYTIRIHLGLMHDIIVKPESSFLLSLSSVPGTKSQLGKRRCSVLFDRGQKKVALDWSRKVSSCIMAGWECGSTLFKLVQSCVSDLKLAGFGAFRGSPPRSELSPLLFSFERLLSPLHQGDTISKDGLRPERVIFSLQGLYSWTER
jgi:hypothetical protein